MFLLILKVKLKGLQRILGEEWATYFFLGPVMIGAALLLGRRIYHDFGARIGKIEPIALSEETALRLTLAFLLLKVFFNVIPLARRLYPTERSLAIDDLLPIRNETRYWVFYLEQLLYDLPFFLFAVFLLLFLGQERWVGWAVMIWVLFPAIEIGLTLSWVHVKPPDRLELSLALIVVLWLFWFLSVETLGWWTDLIAPIFAFLGYWGYRHWRYADVARVETFFVQTSSPGAVFKKMAQFAPREVRPLIWRDLVLTFRNFVPLFWRNLILALLIVAAAAVRGNVSIFPFCAAGAFIIASTVSPLFALQRPFRPLDYALPLPVERIWRSKVLYAVLLAFPIAWMIWGLEMILRPAPLFESFYLLFQLLLIVVAVGALTGGTICEGDQKPALHYIIAAFMSALATLFIAAFHPLLFVLVFPVLGNLRGSAVTRLENEEAA